MDFKLSDSKRTLNDQKQDRPLGVTILAVLSIIGGVLGPIVISFFPRITGPLLQISNTLYLVIIVIALIVSIIQIIVGVGLLKGLEWAWTAEFALVILNGAFSTVGGGFLALFVAIGIIIYLTRPHVKRYFGKE